MFLEYFNLNATKRLELLVEICAKTIHVDANFHLVLRKVCIFESEARLFTTTPLSKIQPLR